MTSILCLPWIRKSLETKRPWRSFKYLTQVGDEQSWYLDYHNSLPFVGVRPEQCRRFLSFLVHVDICPLTAIHTRTMSPGTTTYLTYCPFRVIGDTHSSTQKCGALSPFQSPLFKHRYPSHLGIIHHHFTMKFARKSITMDSFFSFLTKIHACGRPEVSNTVSTKSLIKIFKTNQCDGFKVFDPISILPLSLVTNLNFHISHHEFSILPFVLLPNPVTLLSSHFSSPLYIPSLHPPSRHPLK
jgi:hypothetical protein